MSSIYSEWEKLVMMGEKPPKHRKGETENGRESGCRNRKRRRNNIDTVNANSDQQHGN